MKKTVYATSLEDLQLKTIGLNHDHCYYLYYGKMEKLPHEFCAEFFNENYAYVLLYEEDQPTIKFVLPISKILDTPNDAELGAYIRELYWKLIK